MGISPGSPITLQKRPPSDNARSSEKSNDDEERAKIAADCVTSGRPKPELEKNMGRNSLLCGKAISLPKPAYPAEAKDKRIAGVVTIEIVIDETGTVIWAKGIEGHELLQEAAIKAACNARYSPMKISGRAVKAGGVITYNFVTQ